MKKNLFMLMMALIVAIVAVAPVNAQDFAFVGRDQTLAVKNAADSTLGFSVFSRGVTGDAGGGVLNTVINQASGLQANGFTSWSAVDVAVGDFNADARLDIASVSQDFGSEQSRLTVFFGLGDGTFGLPQNFATVDDLPTAMAAADIDLDGRTDLAVAQTDFGVNDSVFVVSGLTLATGATDTFNGTYASSGVNPFALGVSIGRLNDDSFADIAVSYSGAFSFDTLQSDDVSGVIADFTGPMVDAGVTFSFPTTAGNPLLTLFATPIAPRSIAIQTGNLIDSISLDADLDVMVATSGGIEIVENQSPAGSLGTPVAFAIPAVGSPLPAGTNPVGVVAPDVNGDNVFDVIALNQGSGTVTTYIALATPAGGYDVPRTSVVGANPIALAPMDFNGDNRVDLVVSNADPSGSATGRVTLLTGNGLGVFTSAGTLTGGVPVGVAVGKIDQRSQTDDVVVADYFFGVSYFSAAAGYSTIPIPAFSNTSLTTAFDGTALNDVVLIEQNFGIVFVLLNPGSSNLQVGTIVIADVFSTDGFFEIPTSATSFRGANGQNNLAWSDVLAPTNTTGVGQIVVGLNNGSGVFRDLFQFRQFVATPGITNISGGDFNNDGIEDLAYIDFNSNFAAVALNDTTDFFLSPRFRETGGFQPVSAAVGDFNDDDNLDMAVLNIGAVNQANQSLVSIMLGSGDGQLRPTGALLQVPNIGVSIVGGLQDTDAQGLGRSANLNLGRQVDFNFDGYPDLAVMSTAGGRGSTANSPTPTVSLLLNREDAPGNFTVEDPVELVDDTTGAGVVLNPLPAQGFSGRPGTFQGGANYLMSVGDYNADGSPDLVVSGATGTAPGTFRSTIYLFGNQTARTVRVARPLRGGGNYGGTSPILNAGDSFVGTATGEFRPLLNILPDTLHISVNGNVWIDENQTSVLNHAPVLTIQRSDLNAPRPGGGRKVIITAGQSANIPVTATDVDRSASTGAGDSVKFALAATPSGVQPPSFVTVRDNGNNTATVQVASADINRGPGNATFRIAVEGTDLANVAAGGRLPLRGRTYFTLVVQPNRPPVVGSIANQTVETGKTATISLSINDADGHRVTSAVRCDRGNFASVSGTTLSLAPGAGDIGTTSCTVTATDEFGLSGTASFAVTVVAANVAPTIAPIQDVTLKAGDVRTVAISANDANGNNGLRLSIVSAPAFVSISDNGNGTGTIRIAPAITDTTGGRVTVQVTDPGGLSAQTSFNVTVQKAVTITAASFAKQSSGSNLFISGLGFGSSGATVTVNGTNISSRIVGQSDTSITLKGNKKKLNLRSGPNQIVVTAGGVTSNTFVLNLLADDAE